METRPMIPHRRPVPTRKTGLALLASALSLAHMPAGDKSSESNTQNSGHADGKRGGGFGGPEAAKSHRRCYVDKHCDCLGNHPNGMR